MVDVYVDDRIISSVETDPLPSLKRAAERSDELDRVLRLKKHPNKKYAASTSKALRKRMNAEMKERNAIILFVCCEFLLFFVDGGLVFQNQNFIFQTMGKFQN